MTLVNIIFSIWLLTYVAPLVIINIYRLFNFKYNLQGHTFFDTKVYNYCSIGYGGIWIIIWLLTLWTL